jgi:cbb3-type cytochrome oxidase maturation protein
MNVLVYLVPLALALGGLGLGAFLWALRNGQFDDLDGAAWRDQDRRARYRQCSNERRHLANHEQAGPQKGYR